VHKRKKEKENEEEITRIRRGEKKGVRESNNEIWCGLSAEEENHADAAMLQL
jgi:hypothetical protein